MRIVFIVCILIIHLIIKGCDAIDVGLTQSWLDSAAGGKYYSEEIIPDDNKDVYGTWKLIGVSGSFSGMGYEPNFDYLEIKPIGIYGLVRNDILFEYGRIEIIPLPDNTTGMLPVKFVPDFYNDLNPYFTLYGQYMELKGTDSLNMNSPCCDMYNYHFKKLN